MTRVIGEYIVPKIISWNRRSERQMTEEKKRRMLLICLEVVSLAVIIPMFYWGSFRLLWEPIADTFYDPHGDLAFIVAFLVVVAFDGVWLRLMVLCPKKDIHGKIILTLLVLSLSAAILSCFFVARALRGAFS